MGTLDRLDISTRPQDTQVWLPMGILQGLAATVLLTSCMNLANMMLAFGSARQKEIAIRLAIGGTRSRIVRQTARAGLDAVARRRRTGIVDGDMGGAMARLVDGDGIPDLPRARSHTR